MNKKTILITGSTDGIGKLAAEKLAGDGHEVYVHGRNPVKLAQVVAALKTVSANEQITGLVADFSDQEAVKKMAKEIISLLPKIDVLINNAGVFKSNVQRTKDGFDIRFAVNYFAPFLLTNALMPLLQKGVEPRVINLSSAAQAPISYEAFWGRKQLAEQLAYAQSKLAITSWSFHLAETYKDLITIAVNPGSLLNTNMVREGYGYHWSSADKGADILHGLATSPNYSNASGKYFDNDNAGFGKAHQDAYDEQEVEKLLQATHKALKLPT